MAASLTELIAALFTGAPTPAAAAVYSTQLTALISLYVCLVAMFLTGVYIRAVRARPELSPERRDFRVWLAAALIGALLVIAANLLHIYAWPEGS